MIGPGGQPSPESADAVDEISAGPRGAPSERPPRRVAIALAAIVLVAGGSWAIVTTHSGRRVAAAPSSGYSYSPIPLPSPLPSPPQLPVGVPLPARTGLRLPFGGPATSGWWDADSGRVTTATASTLPVRLNQYDNTVVPRRSGFATLRQDFEPCDGCPGQAEPVQLVSAEGVVKAGPPANEIAAGIEADTIWVTRYRLPAVSVTDRRQFQGATEINMLGQALTPMLRLPPATDMVREVRGGLLLIELSAQGSKAEVWDFRTGRTLVVLPGRVLGATSTRVVWLQDRACLGQLCVLHVTDLPSTRRHDHVDRAGLQGGAVSPNGRYFAYESYTARDPSYGPGGSSAMVLFDLDTGHRTVVPGSKIASTPNQEYAYSPVWSPDSRYLVMQVGPLPAVWRVGAPRLWLAPVLPVDVYLVGY